MTDTYNLASVIENDTPVRTLIAGGLPCVPAARVVISDKTQFLDLIILDLICNFLIVYLKFPKSCSNTLMVL